MKGMKKIFNKGNKAILTGMLATTISLSTLGQTYTRNDTIKNPDKFYKSFNAEAVIDLERKILNLPKDKNVEKNLNKLLATGDSIFEKNKPQTIEELGQTYIEINQTWKRQYGVKISFREDLLTESLKDEKRMALDCDLITSIYQSLNERHNIKSEGVIITSHVILEVNKNDTTMIFDGTTNYYLDPKTYTEITGGKIEHPKKKLLYATEVSTIGHGNSLEYEKQISKRAREANPSSVSFNLIDAQTHFLSKKKEDQNYAFQILEEYKKQTEPETKAYEMTTQIEQEYKKQFKK